MISSATLYQSLLSKWNHWLFALILIIVLLVGYELAKSIYWNYLIRQSYRDFPQLPRHWFWGHLISVGDKLNPSINQHPDYAFEEVWNELGQPPAYVVDLGLIDRAMLVVADPRIAEAITQPSTEYKLSTPKSDTLHRNVSTRLTLPISHSILIGRLATLPTEVDSDTAVVKVYGTLVVQIPFSIEPDACQHWGVNCPLRSGTKNTLNITLPIRPQYPSVPVEVKLILEDATNKSLFCTEFPARIESNNQP